MERFAIVGRFPVGTRERVRELLAAGPPFDLAETGLDGHAVYLASREVVFVFEGRDAAWQIEELADDFFHPDLVAALAEWRKLLEEDPHIAQPVYAWSRGSEAERAAPGDNVTVAELMSRDFVSAAPEDTVGETVEKLAARTADTALVVDYGRLIGVLTSHDVLRTVAGRAHRARRACASGCARSRLPSLPTPRRRTRRGAWWSTACTSCRSSRANARLVS
jgi:CBS domain